MISIRRPPRTYEGLTTTGYPSSRATSRASSGVDAVPNLGCGMPSSSSSRPNRERSSARSIASGEVPRMRAPAFSNSWASFSGLFPPDDLEHVLGGQRLEVEARGGVVVGRDRLGVGVDHDRIETALHEGVAGVHAGVVELYALPDAVRPA